jgi:hypothetical protein
MKKLKKAIKEKKRWEELSKSIELVDNNIIFIKDILDEENKFKTYDELKNQFNCKINFYNILPRAFK